MDYKQKIKEYLNSDIDVLYKNMLLNLFPELKESEDERIKREIIGFIRNAYWTSNRKRFNELVTWLEKQGEHKPAWSEEDEINYNYVLAACIYYGEAKGYADTETHQKANNWLKSFKERYTWKPSEEQLNALHDAAMYVDMSALPYPKGTLIKLYNQLKKE